MHGDYYLLKQFSKERLYLGIAPWHKYLPVHWSPLAMSVDSLTLIITEIAEDLDCAGRSREIATRIFKWADGQPVMVANDKQLMRHDDLFFMDYKLTGSAFGDSEW